LSDIKSVSDWLSIGFLLATMKGKTGLPFDYSIQNQKPYHFVPPNPQRAFFDEAVRQRREHVRREVTFRPPPQYNIQLDISRLITGLGYWFRRCSYR
jgi:hypothetical protein